MASGKGGPKFVRYFEAVLEALRDLGASARANEVIEWIGRNREIPADEIERVNKSGQTVFENRVHWAKFYLSKAGFIDSTVRGLWVLTDPGKIARLSHADALTLFKTLHQKFVAERKLAAESEIALDDSDDAAPPPAGAPAQDSYFNANEVHETLIKKLYGLSDVGFEHFSVAELRHVGFENVSVTQRSHDRGVDGEGFLLINRFVKTKVMFQCKRYQGSVGSDRIQAFRGAIHGRAERGIIITTGTFTASAKAEAARENATPVELVDIDKLLDILIEEKLGVVETRALWVDDNFFAPFREPA
ncbi:MAG: restriction endonuclease [Parvularculaceae bacterium]